MTSDFPRNYQLNSLFNHINKVPPHALGLSWDNYTPKNTMSLKYTLPKDLDVMRSEGEISHQFIFYFIE